jgi:phosphate-selective porin
MSENTDQTTNNSTKGHFDVSFEKFVADYAKEHGREWHELMCDSILISIRELARYPGDFDAKAYKCIDRTIEIANACYKVFFAPKDA